MIVLDASVVVELLIGGPIGEIVRRDLAQTGEALVAPHLLDVEVASALRSLCAGRQLDSHRTEQYFQDLAELPVHRYSHLPLLGRIWELRHNFTAYDAAYIALAETTGSVLYTIDAKLTKGHRARVRMLAN